ncbi:DUF4019 domain-containing protein [Lysobacter sp. HDW10]|uniref:DUF4019 domain-containing protein n=1 Tax=Lysobacter sp. HDW10 TaxID=2714936 RepID=UPI00140C174C|nr:DUF4019 domain-containing protein [Lysobacter sp. HDW10]QIK80647.1 DUF4019 domain-containing protein [Lysobacter sp. HDW10]
MKKASVWILLLLPTFAYGQESLKIRESTKGNFVATLNSSRELSIEESQSRVLAQAAQFCGELIPQLGRYKFNLSKPTSVAQQSNEKFEFNQDFTCQDHASVEPSDIHPTSISDAEKKRVVDLATSETRKIISASNATTYEAFHKYFSATLSSMFPLEEWIDHQTTLHSNAGAMKPDPLLKVTTYLDPQNAPGPGLYIAVDFQVSYDRAPFRCGYLIWLFDQQANLSVLRIEDGIIYSKVASGMTKEALEQTKQQYRCFAP